MDYSGQRIAQYQVIEKLGQGGMAAVYRAYDTRLERDVAIKVVRKESIPPEQLERILKRFEREAKSLAKFLHPNIVPVHDYGEFEGAPYLVMAYLPGGTLKDRIGSPVPVQEALSYVTPIANALAYAHRRGVIHRDVKPSNILITEDSTVMLSDFGIAQILEESTTQLTATGMGVGTPEYMAPEQWQGEATEASDQYALGVVLYELLTGQKPFSAETPLAVALKVMSDPLPKPSGLVSGIPEELEKVLYKALARDPQDRYEEMNAFANNLRDFLAGTETTKQARPIHIAQPMKPTSELPHNICESVTRDKLDVTPAGGIPKPKAIEIAKKKGLPKWIGWALGGIVGLILITLALNFVSKSANTTKDQNTQIASFPTTTEDAIATTAETTTPTLNATSTFTPEPTLGLGSIQTNEIDGAAMVFVPAGEFSQGIDSEVVDWIREQSWCTWTTYYNNRWHTTTCAESYFSDSVPKHDVYLDSYWIYQTEVTNSQYAEFLNEVGNKKEGALDPGAAGEDVVDWYGYLNVLNSIEMVEGVWQVQSGFEDYPVSEITWYGADAYCEWSGGRLPTESEWEKAARGTDERLFPWGDEIPNSQLVNFGNDSEGPQKVGSYPNGISPYGVLDMAGNVSEWVADTYNAYYYADSPYENPLGPNAGTFRVYRGGNWAARTYMLLVIMRGGTHAATSTNGALGFRCVVDP